MENHLNMVRPVVETPAVSLRVIAAILNSDIVDAAFRCISAAAEAREGDRGEEQGVPSPHEALGRRGEVDRQETLGGEVRNRQVAP
jgi:hypothetical protein